MINQSIKSSLFSSQMLIRNKSRQRIEKIMQNRRKNYDSKNMTEIIQELNGEHAALQIIDKYGGTEQLQELRKYQESNGIYLLNRIQNNKFKQLLTQPKADERYQRQKPPSFLKYKKKPQQNKEIILLKSSDLKSNQLSNNNSSEKIKNHLIRVPRQLVQLKDGLLSLQAAKTRINRKKKDKIILYTEGNNPELEEIENLEDRQKNNLQHSIIFKKNQKNIQQDYKKMTRKEEKYRINSPKRKELRQSRRQKYISQMNNILEHGTIYQECLKKSLISTSNKRNTKQNLVSISIDQSSICKKVERKNQIYTELQNIRGSMSKQYRKMEQKIQQFHQFKHPPSQKALNMIESIKEMQNDVVDDLVQEGINDKTSNNQAIFKMKIKKQNQIRQKNIKMCAKSKIMGDLQLLKLSILEEKLQNLHSIKDMVSKKSKKALQNILKKKKSQQI